MKSKSSRPYLMDTIGQLIPAPPAPIAATALLQAGPPGLGEFHWKTEFYRLAGELRSRGTFVVVPHSTREHTFETALGMRRLIGKTGDAYRPAPGAESLAACYAHSLAGTEPGDAAGPRNEVRTA